MSYLFVVMSICMNLHTITCIFSLIFPGDCCIGSPSQASQNECRKYSPSFLHFNFQVRNNVRSIYVHPSICMYVCVHVVCYVFAYTSVCACIFMLIVEQNPVDFSSAFNFHWWERFMGFILKNAFIPALLTKSFSLLVSTIMHICYSFAKIIQMFDLN